VGVCKKADFFDARRGLKDKKLIHTYGNRWVHNPKGRQGGTRYGFYRTPYRTTVHSLYTVRTPCMYRTPQKTKPRRGATRQGLLSPLALRLHAIPCRGLKQTIALGAPTKEALPVDLTGLPRWMMHEEAPGQCGTRH
jgi:hypothetical protein